MKDQGNTHIILITQTGKTLPVREMLKFHIVMKIAIHSIYKGKVMVNGLIFIFIDTFKECKPKLVSKISLLETYRLHIIDLKVLFTICQLGRVFDQLVQFSPAGKRTETNRC